MQSLIWRSALPSAPSVRGKVKKLSFFSQIRASTALPNALKAMDYKEKKDKDYLEAKNFSLMREGTGRLNDQGRFVVRLAQGGKAGFETVEKKMREYFRDIGKKGAFPDMEPQQNAGELTAEEINAFEMKAAENDKYFTGEDEDGSGPQAAAAESPAAGVTGDADSETELVVFTPPPSDAGDDVPEENLMEDVEESDSEDEEEEEGDDKSLSDELKQGIATASATIAGHAISLSRQIGAGQKAELGPLTDKITAWLEDMLAGTPPEEREMAAAQLHQPAAADAGLSRESCGISNMWTTLRPPMTASRTSPAARRSWWTESISTASRPTISPAGGDGSLFKLAKARATSANLAYPMNQAEPQPDRGHGGVGLAQGGGSGRHAAGRRKRKAVQRLIAVMQQMFVKRRPAHRPARLQEDGDGQGRRSRRQPGRKHQGGVGGAPQRRHQAEGRGEAQGQPDRQGGGPRRHLAACRRHLPADRRRDLQPARRHHRAGGRGQVEGGRGRGGHGPDESRLSRAATTSSICSTTRRSTSARAPSARRCGRGSRASARA